MASRIIDSKETDRFYEFVFAHPDEFDGLKRPEGAQETARAIASGSIVKMGTSPHTVPQLQSISVPKRFGRAKAKDLARRIARELED
jgi:hypothetical protein